MWKFNWKMGKDKWLMILAAGVILLILAFPSGKKTAPAPSQPEQQLTDTAGKAAAGDGTYEAQLEKRVKQILKNVDGVGTVDVMIVLKSSEEKVIHVDTNTSDSSTEEQDTDGGTRKVTGHEKQESTVLTGSGSENTPIVEKELKPEIAGIIISAAGGGSPTVKAEISSAMEALFDLPPHKIKVLKRVE